MMKAVFRSIAERLCVIRLEQLILILIPCTTMNPVKAELPDNNLGYPVLIESEHGGVGSGFFLEAGRQIYLITASHVLFSSETRKMKGSYARVTAQSPGQGSPVFRMSLNLPRLIKDSRIRIHGAHDVMLIHIGEMEGGGDSTAPLEYKNGVTTSKGGTIVVVAGGNTMLSDSVKVSREVFVLGFPKSVGIRAVEQVDFLTPLVRRGIVAGKNLHKGSIILDCQVDGGNSGGPVIQVSHDEEGNDRFCVIGLVTEFIPNAEEWVNRNHGQVRVNFSNSGYSVVVPMDSVWEMIESERLNLTQRRVYP